MRTPRDLLSRRAEAAVAVAVVTPVLGLAVLLAAPRLDPHWDHQPSHFWLVLGAAAVAAVLGWSVAMSARKRSDGRLVLVSRSFIASALFLGLHALATPRVLLAGSTAGFVVAVPVGLLIAGALAVWSAMRLDGARARWVVTRSRRLHVALLAIAAAWCVGSLAGLAPLNDPTPVESGSAFMIILGLPAAVAFGVAAWRYLVLAYRRRATLLVAIAAAWVLLAEAAVAVSITENWRMSWWMWHILMLGAFGAIASAVARMPEDERFSDLYLDEVVGGTREVSVLFADLQGFTQFSEQHPPETVRGMLNTYLEAVLPPVAGAHVVSLGAVSLKTRTAQIDIWRLDDVDDRDDRDDRDD